MGTPSMRPGTDRRRAKRAGPSRRAASVASRCMAPLLTETQAAEILRVSPRTLQGWRHRGEGPPYVKMGAAVRYRRDDLRRFIVRSVRGKEAAE